MKVLFITYDFPYPTNSGGKARAYNLIKFGKDKNVEILLFSFVRDSFKKKYEEELLNIGVSKIYTHRRHKVKSPSVLLRSIIGSSIFKNLYFDKKVEEKILDIIKDEKIEVVVFESFYTCFYISDAIKNLGVRQIFGTENIEHALYFDFAKSKPSIFRKPYMIQVERVRAEEEKAYNDADAILAVTQEEKSYIQKKTKKPIYIIPNGIDARYLAFKQKKTTSKNLLFVGNFSYFPNIEAMEFFYNEVFLQLMDVTLTIIGKNQDKLSFFKKNEKVQHVEYIEDIRNAYYDADVFVFPVRFGGGTNFKVLEAASCGTPIVAFPDRVKGLGFLENKQYVAAQTPQEFRDGIEKLFDNEKTRGIIAKNARMLVEKEYDWKEIGEKLRGILISTSS